MADRSSAYLFNLIFNLIEDHVPKEKWPELTTKFWSATRDYDFSEYQMGCDETLINLGLARMVPNTEYPDEGDIIEYGPSRPNGGDPR